ncbi:MAG: hypothetical protein M1839_003306 [Geoglossum umbratile]|nr:MAG: hypothetical protein M1839_003306 [Geoglossum umbratile]
MKGAASGRMYEKLEAACRDYGPLVRISGSDLITDNPDILFKINGARSQYRRSGFYKSARLDPTRGNVLSEQNETRHTELRSRVAAGYSGKENLHLEESIDNRVLDLVRLLQDKYLSDGSCIRPVDFARKAQFFTLDVITDIAFGEPFGDLVADKDVHEYLTTVDRMMVAIRWVAVFPALVDVLAIPWIGRTLLPSAGDDFGIGKVMGVAKRVVAQRYGPDRKECRDMLGSFVRHGLTQEEAENESLIQIVAGTETTATAIRSTLLHIITQPKVYATLQAEIDEANRDNRTSKPIRDAKARELPYLLACIREGLRIWPPVPDILSKTAPAGGDVLGGKFVPGGTNIGVCSWGVQRNKSVFGQDADMYRPERWLEASGEQLVRMEKTNDLVFGHGRYQCLGRNIAMIELRKVLVEVRN